MSFDPALGNATLADLLAMILADETLPPDRRSQMSWAIRKAAKILGKPLESLPASLLGLRFGINKLHPARLGVSKKLFDNWRSALKAAIRYGARKMALPARGTRLGPTWQLLFDAMTDFYQRRGLVRFLRYCSAHGIEPDQVSDEVLLRFKQALETDSFVQEIDDLIRRVAILWNRAVSSTPDWPTQLLTVPDNRPPRRLRPLSDYPISFREDLEKYLSFRSIQADRPRRLRDKDNKDPLSVRTIETRRKHLLAAASAVVQEGYPIEQIRGLSDLTRPANVEKMAEHHCKQNQRVLGRNEIKPYTLDLVRAVRTVAKEWTGPTESELEDLDAIVRNLEKILPPRAGLTKKNADTIRPFLDPRHKTALIGLPERLFTQATKSNNRYRAAVTAQLAIAIAVLLCAPMRIANLASLRIGKELQRVSSTDSPIEILIDGPDVKNGRPLVFPLPRKICDWIDIYLAKFRPRLVGSKTDWLFPGEEGHKTETTLLQQISERTYSTIGIRLTPHQFRHLVSLLHLESEPGNFHDLQAFLGHRSLATTIRFYGPTSDMLAQRRYHGKVLGYSGPTEDRK